MILDILEHQDVNDNTRWEAAFWQITELSDEDGGVLSWIYPSKEFFESFKERTGRRLAVKPQLKQPNKVDKYFEKCCYKLFVLDLLTTHLQSERGKD